MKSCRNLFSLLISDKELLKTHLLLMKAKKAESGQTLLILQVNKKSQTIFDDKINLHHSLKVLSIGGGSSKSTVRGRSFGLSRWCSLAGKFTLNWPFEEIRHFLNYCIY